MTCPAPTHPRSFVFLLVPEFTMMSFTAAIEPLRVANRMSGRMHYRWHIASRDGGPVVASNGTAVAADFRLDRSPPADAVVVCAGIDVYHHLDPGVAAQLRRLARRGSAIGSVCTGSVVLAEAGLLEGHRCTVHWEDIDSLSENYPALTVTRGLFEIDGARFTCSGGIAPLDLMMHFIGIDLGRDLAMQVADQMLHHSVRQASQPQRLALSQRTGVRHPRLLEVVAAMEETLENPLSIKQLSTDAGLSQRQLERLFAQQLGVRPAQYYRALRLHRARQLVQQTGMTMLQVAVATGFASATHFARAYGAAFGATPSRDRNTQHGSPDQSGSR